MRYHRPMLAIAGLLALAAGSLAEFGTPDTSDVQERVTGEILPSDEGITPEPGDQIGAFFEDKLVGVFTITSSTAGEFSFVVYGDDPGTAGDVEGPAFGAQAQFRFFDSSTNQTIPMTVVNLAGENSLYVFQGSEAIDLPVVLPGFDLIPVQNINLRIGAVEAPGGDGGGGADAGKYDVNADGRIDTADAAAVLRVVTRATSDHADRADVDGNGVVNTRDAVAVLQAR